jgi:hypothetical protein
MKSKIASACVVLLVAASSAFADQPHMKAALDHLRMARAELQKAASDKDGHRQNAIVLVDKAVVEVEAGEIAARPRR